MRGSRQFFPGGRGGPSEGLMSEAYLIILLCTFIKFEFSRGSEPIRPTTPPPPVYFSKGSWDKASKVHIGQGARRGSI